MNAQDLKDRTKQFAIRIMRLADSLSDTVSARAISKQIVRSGTSVAANYRSALRARSTPEFISKINIVIEECDETLFWLDLIMDAKILNKTRISALYAEANELVSIFCATQKTMKSKKIRNQKSEIINHKSEIKDDSPLARGVARSAGVSSIRNQKSEIRNKGCSNAS